MGSAIRKHPMLLAIVVSAIFAAIGFTASIITSDMWIGVAVGFFCQVSVALVVVRMTHVRAQRTVEVIIPPVSNQKQYGPSRWMTLLFGQPLFYFLLLALVVVAATGVHEVAIALAVMIVGQAIGRSVYRRQIYQGRGRPSGQSGSEP